MERARGAHRVGSLDEVPEPVRPHDDELVVRLNLARKKLRPAGQPGGLAAGGAVEVAQGARDLQGAVGGSREVGC